GAHQRSGLAIYDGGTESRRIGIDLVVFADGHVHGVAGRLRSGMHRKMFRSRDGAGVFGIVTLQAGDKGDTELRGQEGVFAIGLLATAPARIAEDVDIGRPEIEPGVKTLAPLP